MRKFSDYPWYELGHGDGAIGFDSEEGQHIIVDRYWPETSWHLRIEDDEERNGNIALILYANEMYKALYQIKDAIANGNMNAIEQELKILDDIDSQRIEED